MGNYWNKMARFYNLSRVPDREAYSRMYTLLREKIQGKDVLELATGTGIIAYNTANAARSFIATDYAEKMIEVAVSDHRLKDFDNLRFEQADATNLPYKDHSFDVIIIANALHIMPNPEKAVSEIKRVLKPNGTVIAPTYIHGANTLRQRIKAGLFRLTGFEEYRHWTQETYCQWLEQQGLRIRYQKILKASFPLAYTECSL